jgi:hypothetical protein
MAQSREGASATLLDDGRVLLVGGQFDPYTEPSASAEVFDPDTSDFSTVEQRPIRARIGHTATRLRDGTVLLVGGYGPGISLLASAELFDPVDGSFRPAGPLRQARAGHTATLLPDGRVLVVGGSGAGDLWDGLRSVEVYDPATRRFTLAGWLNEGRDEHTSTLLDDGSVLVVGGGRKGGRTAEIFDPVGGVSTRLERAPAKTR